MQEAHSDSLLAACSMCFQVQDSARRMIGRHFGWVGDLGRVTKRRGGAERQFVCACSVNFCFKRVTASMRLCGFPAKGLKEEDASENYNGTST